jgi:DNA invertase Pin-like site-specific DNA recombinase
MATMFGMLAEIGHQIVSRHTKEALALAKRRGRIGGRPALSPQQQDLAVKFYQQGEHAVWEICQMLGISKTTLYSYINKANVPLRSHGKNHG